MRLNTGLVDLAELTLAIRQVNIPRQYTLRRFLPLEQRDSIEYRYIRNDRARRRVASYRAYDTPPRVGARPGADDVRGTLPPIDHLIPLGEEEQLRLNAARNARGGAELEALFEGDARTAAFAVAGRMELAMGQALSTGKVTIGTPAQQENGLALEADFGVPSDHIFTAAQLFTAAGADVLGQLESWLADYEEDSDGVRPGVMVGSRSVRAAMLSSEPIRQLATTVGGTPASVSAAQLNQILESRDLPPFELYSTRVHTPWGAVEPVLPVDRLLLLPGPDDPERVGTTQVGRTLEADDLVRQRVLTEEIAAGIVVLVYEEDLPKRYYTRALSIVLPTIKAPELIMSAKVI